MCTGTNIHIRHCWNHLVLRRIKSTGGNTTKRDYHLIYEIKMIWSNQNLLYMRRSYIDQMQTNWNIFGGGMLGGSSEDGIHLFLLPRYYRPSYWKRNLEIKLPQNLLRHQKVTERPHADLIQLYAGTLTGPDPAETCFAERQRNIYCFQLYLVRFLLTCNGSLPEEGIGRNQRGYSLRNSGVREGCETPESSWNETST